MLALPFITVIQPDLILWAWLDLYPPADVRIIFYPLDRWGNPALLSEVEAELLRATEPPYNAQIPME
jgi:hypothetical protein